MNNLNKFKEDFEINISKAKSYLNEINILLKEQELLKKNTNNSLNYSHLKKFVLFISTVYLCSILMLIYYQNSQIKLITNFNKVNYQMTFDKGFKKGYYKGQADIKLLLNNYFIENPLAMEEFENWIENEY